MVPCVHQGNIYIKRKLRVWRDQKYIPLVGGITPLKCAGRQNTPSRGRQYRAQYGKLSNLPVRAVKIPRLEGGSIGPSTESCINCDRPISMVPCLHQGNIYIKRKLRVWRDQKCTPLVDAIILLPCAGRQNIPSRGRQYRAQYGKLHKL